MRCFFGCPVRVAAAFLAGTGNMPLQAQMPPAPPVAPPLGDGVVDLPELRPDRPEIGSSIAGGAEGDAPAVSLGDDDLKQDPRLADFVLGQAVQAGAWPVVDGILRYYSDIPGHDPMMALYAQGALDRQQGRHGAAIAAYRRMVEYDASLDYVRLDLAAMMAEDRRYRDARAMFEILRRDPDLVPGAKEAVERYLAQIGEQQGWNGTIRVGYKFNDNVNNASSERILWLFGLPFEKDPESLPHSAHAISYHANLNRDLNVGGNHFLSLDATVEGDHYWDDKPWREITATLRAGYKYRDLKSWFSALPSISRQWLGGSSYRRTIGGTLEYGRWASAKWQLIGNYSWFGKTYDQPGHRFYDGDLHAVSLTAVHVLSPRMILYGGLTAQRDLLEAEDESSRRIGASVGVVRQWKGGLQMRGNARYGYRKFDALGLWDRTRIRRDHEYQVDVSLTHDKLAFRGILPRLAWQFIHVDSSISSLHSRTGNQFLLTLEKNF